jgi:prefoldin subunit 5
MSISEEKREAIRSLKYRLQELDSKIQASNPNMNDIESKIAEIQELARKLT